MYVESVLLVDLKEQNCMDMSSFAICNAMSWYSSECAANNIMDQHNLDAWETNYFTSVTPNFILFSPPFGVSKVRTVI